MNKENLKYLEGIRYSGFQERLKNLSEKDSCFFIKLTPLYKELQKESSIYKIIKLKIKNKFSFLILYFWRISGIFLEQIYYSKKYKNFTTLNNLVDKDYPYIVFLKSLAPSKYDSQYNILKGLNNRGVKAVIITRNRVLKAKYKELKNLNSCKILLWDFEIKKLDLRVYLKLNAITKKRAENIINQIQDKIIAEAIKEKIDFLEFELKHCELLYCFYKKLFRKDKKITAIDNSFYGPISRVPNFNNIRKVALQHGVISNIESHGVPSKADIMFLWGKFWQKNALNWLFTNTKIVITGSPRFDNILSWKNSRRVHDFYNKLRLSSAKKTIIFFSSSNGPEISLGFYEKIIRNIGFIKNRFEDDINFIIKLHPGGEKKDKYIQSLKDKDIKEIAFIQGNNVPLYELLAYCDLAIALSSTALLEAMAFEIPVIQFNPDENLRVMEFSQYGGGILARQTSVLLQEINRLLFDKIYNKKIVTEQNNFLSGAMTNVGTSTKKIINYLLENE